MTGHSNKGRAPDIAKALDVFASGKHKESRPPEMP